MSFQNAQNSKQNSKLATMETLGAGTSFDVICDKSQLRHYKIIDRVRKGLQKSQPQSDQTESVLQSLMDKTKQIVDDVLLKQTKRASDIASAEYVAERWDQVLWGRYRKSSTSSHHEPRSCLA